MNKSQFGLNGTVNTINAAQHYDSLWSALIGYLTHAGADLISYRHVAPPHAPDAGRVDVLLHGFPKAWEKIYDEKKLHIHDVLTNTAFLHMLPFRWSEAMNRADLDAPQKDVITALKEWMKGDGYVIPLFGPSGRSGFFGVANSASIEHWDNSTIRDIQWVCQQFHLRYAALRIGELPSDFSLDDQEHKLLKGLTRGQSPIAIAKEMGLKADRITSALDMLMLKMSVSDMPSLIIRAESLNLVKRAS